MEKHNILSSFLVLMVANMALVATSQPEMISIAPAPAPAPAPSVEETAPPPPPPPLGVVPRSPPLFVKAPAMTLQAPTSPTPRLPFN